MSKIKFCFLLFLFSITMVSCERTAPSDNQVDIILETTFTETLILPTSTVTQTTSPTKTPIDLPTETLTPNPTPTEISIELWGSPYMVQKSLSAEGFAFGPISIDGINESLTGFLFMKKENGDLFDMDIQTTLIGPSQGITYTKTFICLPHPFTAAELDFVNNFVHIFWENIFAPGIWPNGVTWVDNTLSSIQLNTEEEISYGEYSAKINLGPCLDCGVCYNLTVWVTSLWDE